MNTTSLSSLEASHQRQGSFLLGAVLLTKLYMGLNSACKRANRQHAPRDYNSYKVTDKKTINSDDDTSSEGSVASLTDEDYDAMFDYDYADSENMHPSLQAKTATKARKHISMSRRSMTAMLKRAETAGFSVKPRTKIRESRLILKIPCSYITILTQSMSD